MKKKENILLAIIGVLSVLLVIATFFAFSYRSRLKEVNRGRDKKLSVHSESGKLKTEPYSPDEENKRKIAALKKRIHDLEEQLRLNMTKFGAQLDSENNRYSSKHQTLEELKQSDPVRYEKIMAYYRKMSSVISDNVQDKLLFFNDIDTSLIPSKYQDAHLKLLEQLAKLDEFSQNNLDKDDLELRDTYKEQRKKLRSIYKNLQTEKSMLVIYVGKQMGLSDKQARLLQKQLQQINSVTSYRSFYHRKK